MHVGREFLGGSQQPDPFLGMERTEVGASRQPQNLAFGGADRSSLYVVGRGVVWRIDTLTRGPDRAK